MKKRAASILILFGLLPGILHAQMQVRVEPVVLAPIVEELPLSGSVLSPRYSNLTTQVSGLVLEHLRDLAVFFTDVRRVLRPTGRAVVSAMHPAMFARGSQARFTDPDSGDCSSSGLARAASSERRASGASS